MSEKLFNYTQDAISEAVDNVLVLAKKWGTNGPKKILDEFNEKQEFGVEIETYMPGSRHRETPNEVEDWLNLASPRTNQEMVKLWAKLVVGEVPPEIVSALNNHSYNEGINTETDFTVNWVRILDRFFKRTGIKVPDNLDPNNFKDAVTLCPNRLDLYPTEFISCLRNSYAAAYLKYKASGRVSHSRFAAFAKIIDEAPKWRIGYDSTIVSGRGPSSCDEIISHKLVGKEGLKELENVVRILDGHGFKTNLTCGGHTSINHTGGVGKYMPILAILLLVGRLEEKLHGTLPYMFRASKDKAVWVSQSFDIDEILKNTIKYPARDALNKLTEDPRDKYKSINIGHYLRNNRVEIRSWQCTLDPDTWKAQVVLSQKISEEAAKLSKVLAKIRREFREINGTTETKPKIDLKELRNKYSFSEFCSCPDCVELRNKYTILGSKLSPQARWYKDSLPTDGEDEYAAELIPSREFSLGEIFNTNIPTPSLPLQPGGVSFIED